MNVPMVESCEDEPDLLLQLSVVQQVCLLESL
eukprot:CAMPEP_0172689110 /NCGR_PEP_ID=MMETSP1074-20121228/22916_1 /TAXON_ID=2916 /ORGANISM="Ceratium fusus, Strain PA161109" /LENGTH=31 /DNA_ID= /DNA_START= /DNA_END= /DNA_ORIENTATION=